MMRRLLIGLAVLAVASACAANPASRTATSSSPPAAAVRTASPRPQGPARPAASHIQAAAVRTVMVTAVPGGNDRARPPAPLFITDPAKVRSLVALVNALPLFPPGARSCPFDDGRGVRLTFLSRSGAGKASNGPVIRSAILAVAFAKSDGCGGVRLAIAGAQTSLGWGPAAAEKALSISGMRWKLFGYLS